MKTDNDTDHLDIIGRRTLVDIPELNLHKLLAKVDTGAYSCSLHCSQIDIDDSGAEPVLVFTPLDDNHPGFKQETHRITNFRTRRVRSSSVNVETRYMFDMTLLVNGKSITTPVTLSSRDRLKVPLLLGRRLLRDNFLVDVRTGVNKKDIPTK